MNDLISVKELRKITGLSQTQFASKYRLGLHQLQTWEQGRTNTPEYCLYMLNRLVRIDFIVDDCHEVNHEKIT